MVLDGVGDRLDCKAMVRRRWLARQDNEMATQEEATQQPANTLRGQEGGATGGRQEIMMRQPACATR